MEILLRSHTDGLLQRNIKHNVFSNLKGKISLDTLCVTGLNIAESRFFLISDPFVLSCHICSPRNLQDCSRIVYK